MTPLDWNKVDWKLHARPDCPDCLGSGEVTDKLPAFDVRSVCWCVDVKRIVAEYDAAQARPDGPGEPARSDSPRRGEDVGAVSGGEVKHGR